MLLRTSPSSPFGRKVKIAASLLGLMEEIKLVPTDTLDPNDQVRKDNPLGKIPVLILDDGSTYFDSRVILEYLDMKAGGGKIVPSGGPEKMAALRLQALADGILDAALLIVYEGRYRPENKRVESWIEHQQAKVDRSLAVLEASPPPAPGGKAQIGDITLACALGYLDFRFKGAWRGGYPKLVQWLDRFAAANPIFEKTRPPAA